MQSRALRALAAVLSLSNLPAAVVPRLGLDQMISESARIVHGRVLSSQTGSSARFIWTHYRVQVLETWKGDASREIIVSEPGGSLNGLSMEIAGAVTFGPGEEVVLFLYQTPIGYWRTSGYWQGKLNVSEQAGVKQVRTNLRRTALLDLSSTPLQDRLESVDNTRLIDLRARVRESMRR
jgi:hypothetical protein